MIPLADLQRLCPNGLILGEAECELTVTPSYLLSQTLRADYGVKLSMVYAAAYSQLRCL